MEYSMENSCFILQLQGLQHVNIMLPTHSAMWSTAHGGLSKWKTPQSHMWSLESVQKLLETWVSAPWWLSLRTAAVSMRLCTLSNRGYVVGKIALRNTVHRSRITRLIWKDLLIAFVAYFRLWATFVSPVSSLVSSTSPVVQRLKCFQVIVKLCGQDWFCSSLRLFFGMFFGTIVSWGL